MDFLMRLDLTFNIIHWQVYETSLPYASGGLIKLCIAALSNLVDGHDLWGTTFGNTFTGILVESKQARH